MTDGVDGLLRDETLFAKLAKRQLKRGVFPSVVALQQAINGFVAAHNRKPKPSSGKPTPRPSLPPPNEGTKRVGFDPLTRGGGHTEISGGALERRKAPLRRMGVDDLVGAVAADAAVANADRAADPQAQAQRSSSWLGDEHGCRSTPCLNHRETKEYCELVCPS